MKKTKKRKLMLRWAFVSAGLIALFWTIWYLIAGSVPVVNQIRLTQTKIYQLPLGISRWWDVLIGPIWSIMLILLFTSKGIRKNEDLVFGLVFGLGFGLVFGLGFGLVFALGVGLGAGLVFGLVFGLGVGLGAGLGAGLSFGLKFLFSQRCWRMVRNWLLVKE